MLLKIRCNWHQAFIRQTSEHKTRQLRAAAHTGQVSQRGRDRTLDFQAGMGYKLPFAMTDTPQSKLQH